MHYYKLQMNTDGDKHPDWQTIGELVLIHPLENPTDVRFWISDATPDDIEISNQTDGKWNKINGGFNRTHIDEYGCETQFQLLKD